MIDIVALRQGYDRRYIKDIGWDRSGHNIADSLTKPGPCPSLDIFLQSGQLHLDVAQ